MLCELCPDPERNTLRDLFYIVIFDLEMGMVEREEQLQIDLWKCLSFDM